jgi:hypothetical protein
MLRKGVIALEYYHKWVPSLSTNKRLMKLERSKAFIISPAVLFAQEPFQKLMQPASFSW